MARGNLSMTDPLRFPMTPRNSRDSSPVAIFRRARTRSDDNLGLEARVGIGHLSGGCRLKLNDFEREPTLNERNSGTADSNSFGVRFGVQGETPRAALS
jgi:hypothetical protein